MTREIDVLTEEDDRLAAQYREAAANRVAEAEALEWIEWAPGEGLED